MNLSNKDIAKELYRLASEPLQNTRRFEATIDGLTVRSKNTRPDIEAMARKFEKATPAQFKTKQRTRSGISPRKESPKAIYKRYQTDPDACEFAQLFGTKIQDQLAKDLEL